MQNSGVKEKSVQKKVVLWERGNIDTVIKVAPLAMRVYLPDKQGVVVRLGYLNPETQQWLNIFYQASNAEQVAHVAQHLRGPFSQEARQAICRLLSGHFSVSLRINERGIPYFVFTDPNTDTSGTETLYIVHGDKVCKNPNAPKALWTQVFSLKKGGVIAFALASPDKPLEILRGNKIFVFPRS